MHPPSHHQEDSMLTHRISVFILAIALSASAPALAKETFFADLSGDQEVPSVVTTPTSGKFHIQFSKDYTEAEFTLRVDDGNQLFMAHLHCAAAGVNGPVVVWLAGQHPSPGGWNVDGKWIGNTILNSSNIVNTTCGANLAELAAAMRAGHVYVNVHSRTNPSGEVRGQIVP
jgi:hypothetical protein